MMYLVKVTRYNGFSRYNRYMTRKSRSGGARGTSMRAKLDELLFLPDILCIVATIEKGFKGHSFLWSNGSDLSESFLLLCPLSFDPRFVPYTIQRSQKSMDDHSRVRD